MKYKTTIKRGLSHAVVWTKPSVGSFDKVKLLRFTLLSMLCILFGGSAFADDVTETITLSEQGYENGQSVTSTEGTVVVLTYDQGTGTTAPAYYNTGAGVRVYAGGKMIVTANENTIKKVIVTFGKDKSPTISMSSNGTTESAGTSSPAEWTGTATEVYFNVSDKGHARIQSVEVTYTPNSSSTDTRIATTMTLGDCATTGEVNSTIDLPTATVSVTGGDVISGATVDWSSSDVTIASIAEGKIYLHKAGTTTIKAEYAGDNTYKPSSASYTLTVTAAAVAYTTLKDLQEAATSTSTPVTITFNNVYVNAVKGKNAYLADADGYGVLVYQDNHGLEAGKVLNGTINANLVLYRGQTEITGFSAEGLTITEGSLAPVEKTIGEITAANQSTLVTLKNVTFSNGKLSDGTNEITYYNNFSAGDLTEGKIYDITGIVIVYNTIEIAPRTADDIVEIGSDTRSETTVTFFDGYEITGVAGTTIDLPTYTVNDATGASIENATVTWSSSNEGVATISDAAAVINLLKAGTTTIKAEYAGDDNYKASSATYEVTVTAAPEEENEGVNYVKVTKIDDLTDGEYLIVNETANVAFDGSLEKLDAVNDVISVTINEGVIASTSNRDAATFTITNVDNAYTVKAASGQYIGIGTYGNGLDQSDNPFNHSISFDDAGNAVMVVTTSGGDMTLRYNKASNQNRFRYYKTGQDVIQLYKKVVEEEAVDGNYYVVGNMTGWVPNAEYKMTRNTAAETEEYMITMNLTTKSEFKVARSDDGQNNEAWYPDNADNYGVGGQITADGEYTIYFRPKGDGGDDWYYHYIYVVAVQSPSTWRDIKADFTNGSFFTANDTEVTTAGLKMNDDGSFTRVPADDETANALITGKFHDNDHGIQNFSAVVKVEGPVKISFGTCAWGGNVTVKDATGAEVVPTFTTNTGSCYHQNKSSNIVSAYYKGEAATLTIAGGSYVPYFAVEAVAPSDIPNDAKVTFSITGVECEGVAPAEITAEIGSTIIIPLNRTLYKELSTLTAWTDGTSQYMPGDELTVNADITLTPIFTENTNPSQVTEPSSVIWDFQLKNGAPVLNYGSNKTGIYVTQGVIDGVSYDARMTFDTGNSGKIANGSWQNWCQMNSGTRLTIPAMKGMVVSLESYNAMTSTTIAGSTDYSSESSGDGWVVTYTYEGSDPTIDVVIGDGAYFRWFKAVYPAPERLYVVGDIASNGWKLTQMDEVLFNGETNKYELEVQPTETVNFAFSRYIYNTEDWDAFNSNDRLAIGNGNVKAELNTEYTLATGYQAVSGDGPCIQLAAGTYKISITEDLKMTITGQPDQPAEDTYVVAGAYGEAGDSEAGFFGTAWDATAETNKLDKQDDGTYKKVFEGVEIADNTIIYYKVVKNATEWIPTANNMEYTVEKGGKFNVTVIYDPEAIDNAVSMSVDATVAGDATLDGEVTTSDAVLAVNYIIRKEQLSYEQFKAADYNGNMDVTITDAVAIVNVAISDDVNQSQPAPMYGVANNYLALYGNTVSLTNQTAFVAFQMDVTLADGAVLNGVQLSERAAGLQAYYNRISDNTWRIVGFSTEKVVISGNEGILLTLNISGNSNVTVSNIEFTDATAHAYTLGLGDATGINSLSIDTANTEIYTIDGVQTNGLRKGLNVVKMADGQVRKVLVK